MITEKTKNIVVEILPRLTWLIQFACLGFVSNFQFHENSNLLFAFFGLVLLLCGLVSLVWSFTSIAKAMITKDLITSGPYKHVRHPIYSSIYLSLIGLGIAFPSLAWFLTLMIFLPFWYGISKAEEWQMNALYPKLFSEYRQRTGMFLPRFY